ncbi:SGNH/GDSL hydrolase family protein [Baaleninema sp.]|uniref:SGNH/GDSL hydrolase family protein n=1 Tax=Baaleninema sp. TaxID=3101197 RepID=UPI003D030BEB
MRRRWVWLGISMLLAISWGGCGNDSTKEPMTKEQMVTPSRETLKIMPLGDSITEGYNVPGGYRIDLWQHLRDRGYLVDFVGTQANGPEELPDKDHQGHSGWRIDELHRGVSRWVSQTQPDWVLLLIGTNDMVQGYAVEQAPTRLEGLLEEVWKAAPQAQIFVSSIPPIDQPMLNARVQVYNQSIAEMVARRRERGDRIAFVDVYSQLTVEDLADGIHPNREGHRKIARTWNRALDAALSDR